MCMGVMYGENVWGKLCRQRQTNNRTRERKDGRGSVDCLEITLACKEVEYIYIAHLMVVKPDKGPSSFLSTKYDSPVNLHSGSLKQLRRAFLPTASDLR